MAMVDPSKWIDWVKLSPKYFFVFTFVLGLLLFGPNSLLDGLGVQSFVTTYRSILGVVFLLCLVLFLVGILGIFFTSLKEQYSIRGNLRFQKKRLRSLTDKEKDILVYYIHNQTRSQSLPYNDGLVRELQKLRIIYQASTVSRRGMYFDYNIQPWAWEYLNKHPQLLEKKVENNG